MYHCKKMLSIVLCLLCLVMAGTMSGGITVAAAEKTIAYVPVTGVEIETLAFPDVFPYPSKTTVFAIIYPSNATNKKVTWTSSDKSIATVDQNGVVTSKKRGNSTITVTTEDGGFTDSVTFSLHPESNIQILNPPYTLLVGEKTKLKAKITPYAYPAQWISSNPKIAEIDYETGALIAKAPGTVKIEAKISSYYNSPVDVCEITVHSSPHSYVTLKIGSTQALQNGQKTTIDQSGAKPLKIGGRTVLPIRFIGEKMGAKVKYVNDKAPIVITYGKKNIELTLGSKEIKVIENGKTQKIKLDVAAQKIGGRTYLPLRAIGQALGFDVYYEKSGSAEYVVVNSPKMNAGIRSARIAEAKNKLK